MDFPLNQIDHVKLFILKFRSHKPMKIFSGNNFFILFYFREVLIIRKISGLSINQSDSSNRKFQFSDGFFIILFARDLLELSDHSKIDFWCESIFFVELMFFCDQKINIENESLQHFIIQKVLQQTRTLWDIFWWFLNFCNNCLTLNQS